MTSLCSLAKVVDEFQQSSESSHVSLINVEANWKKGGYRFGALFFTTAIMYIVLIDVQKAILFIGSKY